MAAKKDLEFQPEFNVFANFLAQELPYPPEIELYSRITETEVKDLAAKLNTLAQGLSPNQRALLSEILAVAAQREV